MPVPVHIVAGYLGTGKTTVLQRELRARRGAERVAVLVNDFGQAGFDRDLLGPADDGGAIAVEEIDGACVCCTAPAGFTEALGALLEQATPDRIFIEPTGLAQPADLIDTVRRGPHADQVTLMPLVVLIDPAQIPEPPAMLEPALADQIAAADVLVANRIDLADDAALARFDALAGGLWPAPIEVLQTTQGELPETVWRWPVGERRPETTHGHEHDHDHDGHGVHGHRVQTWRWESEVVFGRDAIESALEAMNEGALGERVARFKGVFRTDEGVFLFEVAGGRTHRRPSGHRAGSRADAIVVAPQGHEGDHCELPPEEALGMIRGRLDGAIKSTEELDRTGTRLEVVLPDGRRPRLDRNALRALPDGIADVSTLDPKRRGEAARIEALFDQIDAPDAGEVVVVATDGFASAPVPLSTLAGGVLLHTLDGEALPPGKGGPFRLLIPGDKTSPCANVKGVARIIIRTAPEERP